MVFKVTYTYIYKNYIFFFLILCIYRVLLPVLPNMNSPIYYSHSTLYICTCERRLRNWAKPAKYQLPSVIALYGASGDTLKKNSDFFFGQSKFDGQKIKLGYLKPKMKTLVCVLSTREECIVSYIN